MSIAVLNQVYDEMRRLAIAGSVVAAGDFRLKKLIPPLEQAGTKAPVFGRVAEAVQAVVAGPVEASAPALLELTTLVNAILYTQGETGVAGPWEPIETDDLWSKHAGAPNAATSPTSARVLKPLLEALSTTGSGRWELIHDAYERGAFYDLRLVRPALAALDDPYSEIADLMADKVLPLYGKAILSELRNRFDPKGRGGNPRRLRLLHALDPAGTRDLIQRALESGSKEVRIVAIACLGAAPEDLSYLIEQAASKAQDVRQAAYRALAHLNDDAALAVLKKSIDGKDLDLAVEALRQSKNARLGAYLIATVERELAALRKVEEKNENGVKIGRIIALLNCLAGRSDPASQDLLANVFARRAELAAIQGDGVSGRDLHSAVVRALEVGPAALQKLLAAAHASLPAEDLGPCFQAARQAMSAAEVFTLFSPYVAAQVNEKKKQRDPAWVKREAILGALGQRQHAWNPVRHDAPPLDPRWLDLAVAIKHLGLVRQLIRPHHAAANAFLQATFDNVLPNAKQPHECSEVVAAMADAEHPGATEAFVAVLEKFGKKATYFDYWLGNIVVALPKSALPRLEALIPSLNERVADGLLRHMHQLRDQP